MSSTDSDRSGSELEVECVGKIRLVSRDSVVPCYFDRSLNSCLNTRGVSVALLRGKTRKRRVGQRLGSSKLDPKNNPESILSQEDLNNIGSKYGFPPNVEVRLPRPEEKVASSDENWTCFYIVLFHLGLRFPISGFLKDILIHYNLAPTQYMPNTRRILMTLIILIENTSVKIFY